MKYVEAQGLRVSAVGLGTWQFGSFEWGYGPAYLDEARAIVRRALELGVTLIDTAEIYGFGRSERTVGEALEGRHEGAVIATKLLPVLPIPPIVRWRARASARRLGVRAIDLYQLHWPNLAVPLGWTMRELGRLRQEGLIGHVGVSNYSLPLWRRAETALGSPVVSNQVQYSLVARAPERRLVPFAQREGRIVIAYSPLGQGLLSGRYSASNRPTNGVRRANRLFTPEGMRRSAGLIEALREIASGHGATPSQVALAWLIRRPQVVAIPGASSVGQLEQNAAAADLELTDAEDARLVAEAERDGF